MAMIKSALEIALERSKDIKMDEAALEANALRIEGKKAAGRYLDDPESGSLAEKLAQYSKEKRNPVREGMFEVLASQIQLPSSEASVAKLDACPPASRPSPRARAPASWAAWARRWPTRGCRPSSSSCRASSSNTWTI